MTNKTKRISVSAAERALADVEVKLVACTQDLEKLDAEIAKYTRSDISGDGTAAKRLHEAAAKRVRIEAPAGSI
jgi:hypothetical protein